MVRRVAGAVYNNIHLILDYRLGRACIVGICANLVRSPNLFFNTQTYISTFTMGVRTKTVKKSARVIIEKYYSRLTLDFHTNKRVTGEVAIIPSKRMRNKIAGFITHLMKRIQRGPVRGISLKLQEEERERRMDFVPERSALDQDVIVIDADTKAMLESIMFKDMSGIEVRSLTAGGH